jgi:hypothetical protein
MNEFEKHICAQITTIYDILIQLTERVEALEKEEIEE